jgi:hypothetical protein
MEGLRLAIELEDMYLLKLQAPLLQLLPATNATTPSN